MQLFQDIYVPALNFVARENLDPLLYFALHWLVSGNEPLAIMLNALGQSVIFGFGVYLLATSSDSSALSYRDKAASGPNALAIIFALLSLVWCCASPWLMKLHWFPMLLAMAYRLEFSSVDRRLSVSSHLAFITVLAMWIWTAGSLAILGCVLAAIWLPLRRYLGALGSYRIPASYVPLLLIGSCVSILVTPQYPMPEYPPGARVTPISYLQLSPRPLLGQWLEPNPLLLETYEQFRLSSLFGFSLLLGFFALSIAAIALSRQSYLGPARQWQNFYGSNRVLLRAMLAVSLCAILLGGWRSVFSCFYPALLEYDPLATVYRIVPGFALSPFSFWIFYFAYILLIDLFLEIFDAESGSVRSIANLGIFAAIGIYFLLEAQPLYNDIQAKVITKENAIVHSPSGAIVRFHGPWAAEAGVAKKRAFENLRRLKSGEDFIAVATAHPNNEEAGLALDGQHGTRWRTAGPQSKGDFFQINFTEEVSILRAVFSIQHTPTDFPRAFKVSTAAGKDLRQTYYTDWPGALHWSPDGYPYYGPQSEVVIDFSKSRSLSQLRLELISGNETFDWSIAEIKLYAE